MEGIAKIRFDDIFGFFILLVNYFLDVNNVQYSRIHHTYYTQLIFENWTSLTFRA